MFLDSLRAGRLVEIDAGPSLADGLGGNADPDTITFAIIQQYVDRIVTVSEESLRQAVAEFGPAGWSVDLGCPSTPEAVYWAVQAARDAAQVGRPAPAYAGV